MSYQPDDQENFATADGSGSPVSNDQYYGSPLNKATQASVKLIRAYYPLIVVYANQNHECFFDKYKDQLIINLPISSHTEPHENMEDFINLRMLYNHVLNSILGNAKLETFVPLQNIIINVNRYVDRPQHKKLAVNIAVALDLIDKVIGKAAALTPTPSEQAPSVPITQANFAKIKIAAKNLLLSPLYSECLTVMKQEYNKKTQEHHAVLRAVSPQPSMPGFDSFFQQMTFENLTDLQKEWFVQVAKFCRRMLNAVVDKPLEDTSEFNREILSEIHPKKVKCAEQLLIIQNNLQEILPSVRAVAK